MSQKKKKSSGLSAGILAFGAVFAIYSALFKPHSIGAYLLALALSGFAGAVIRVMAQGLDTSVNQKTPESLKKVQGETGDPDVDTLLEKGREMIAEIRRENDLIPDSALSDQLDRLENQCAEIFRTVYDKPAKAPQIRKFMEYYLPTTLKMVKGYRMLDERGVNGTEATDDVLDLTTDIDVLQQMLKRDGLTQSDLEAAAQQARQASQIDRAVTRIQRERQTQQPEKAEKQQTAQPQWHIDPRFRPSKQATAQAHRPEEK